MGQRRIHRRKNSRGKECWEIRQIPAEPDLDRLDDGNGIEATLMTNRAQWHKACRVKYSQTILQRRRKSLEKVEQSDAPKVHTRSAHSHVDPKDPVCFFCNKPAGSEVLHEVATKQIDFNVRKAALETEDTELLAKLAPGDMIALEAKYHRNCLRMLYNKARQAVANYGHEEEAQLHGIAFAELVAFMEERRSDDCAPVFKLADQGDLYQVRLEQLGATVGNRIHTTRLKNRLLSELPDLMAHSQGRDTLLTFQDDIGDALKKACDHDSDAMHLVRAAQVVRKEMFATKFNFDGSFHPNCQKESVPTSLLALVNMILDGANIKHQTQLLETGTTTAALTVSQLLVFNSVKHIRAAKSSGTVRHSRERVALKVHAVTRKRGLIDTLFSLGMCVSYDRLLQVSADIANGVCQHFRLKDIVCPPKMRNGLFTTAAVDNIDHNPSSGTAKDSFHGTSISLIQHPTHECAGSDRGVLVMNQSTPSTRSIMPLPQAYTNVPPVALITKQFTAPPVKGPLLGDWLEDSGWTNALVQAEIASPGTADSFIHARHVTKTRHAHQLTAASLYNLLHQAYNQHCTSEAVPPTFEEWCLQRVSESVHFNYWLKTLSLEVLMLMYIRSLREGNFQLYMETLTQLLPWMFALDHTHYSRWLSVHVRDMMVLSDKHPAILEEFRAGKFVVHKTSHKFSAMAIDHCHEQNNALIKGSGGAVSLTENPGALHRWMVAGPEIARMTTDFENESSPQSENRHHEQKPAVQEAFMMNVRSLTAVIEEMGNPFLEESQDLLVLDSKDIMSSSVADTVRKVESLGAQQYKTFVEERLEQQTKPVTDTLPKNKMPLFSHPPVKT
ncbi:hypothetical protein SKAU_G00014800 [Synaphobranchus kaupii]|uniref:Uncharacterized protein n=1 Tax=Synaphobranchus kaupii TaxID=118154 RepID=A0A9Q1GCI0_SYNKA|nr:hypothetical protein SKAU_G00014800 [Synaphobranchus kaupii]